MADKKLSNNFWLSEFTKSNTAVRLGIDNSIPPSSEVEKNLEALAVSILQPVSDNWNNIPCLINSGFRCLELNRALKSKDSSQHVKGQAADIEIPGISNYELAKWIKDNLEYDQLILEMYNPEDPSSGWVHVSYNPEGNRNETLTIFKGGGVSRGLCLKI